MKNAYKNLVGKPEEKTPIGRPRCRRDVIMGWENMDWVQLAQNRDQWRAVVNMVKNLGAPQKAGNVLSR
jgi:hypothetical protein